MSSTLTPQEHTVAASTAELRLHPGVRLEESPGMVGDVGAVSGLNYYAQLVATSLPLVLADILALGVAVGAAAGISRLLEMAPLQALPQFAAAVLLANLLVGLYPSAGVNRIVEARSATLATTFVCGAFLAAQLMATTPQWSGAAVITITWLVALVTIPALRKLFRRALAQTSWWGVRMVVISGGSAGDAAFSHFVNHRQLGLRPIGMCRNTPAPADLAAWDLGPLENVTTIARQNRVYWALVALGDYESGKLPAVIRGSLLGIPNLIVLPAWSEMPSLWARAVDFGGALAIQMPTLLASPLARFVKRLMDIAIVFLLSPLWLLLGIVICAAIKFGSRGPIFYRHQRIGRGGRKFGLWKFRSMVLDADVVLQKTIAADPAMRREWEQHHKLKNDPRVTWVGRWLRKTSLDELPQVLNVLRGEMSLVGPRPIVDDEIEYYGEHYDAYLRVVPGVTGLWQISGRNNTTYERRVELDAYYVRNWSPWFDIYILSRTAKVVSLCEGAY